ncbi:bifunctional metallophosphatase/5'-nucleotidase [Nocardioides cynanchi]|uniref:bifunctional metallophosphatase/5'-nucleotidase n=1 Tax=Nocardioides cynanchi TaxID=2558918 RepID=UPI0012441582|nr:5'-nucleotidase C-terminal domain-containing protein [Nocardioides cynanchi]
MSSAAPTRRGVLTGAAALAAAGYAASPASAASGHGGHSTRLTILGTTDLHGNVFDWDYYKNTVYDDAAHNDIGIAKVQTLIKAQRARLAGQPLLMLDAGDTIQGTPLAYYYAKVEPITSGGTHPMATAMNLVGYDAAALGNHEFNYGIPLLRTYASQLNFPLLGANAVDPVTKLPVFTPYLVKTVRMPEGPDLKVGILGLTNPGIAIWDRDNVAGRIEFPGLVEQATVFVPKLKKLGCDVVVVAAHSGAVTSSSYGDALPYPENASSLVAAKVPDIDAILVGHAHVDIPQKLVTNEQTGRPVLLCEPDFWGMRLAVMELDLVRHGNRWSVASASSQTLNSNEALEDPEVAASVRTQHDKVVAYVNTVIGTSTQAMSAARAPVEDVPIIDFVNYVQAAAVKQGLTGSDASLPVLSIAAPFNRSASFPAGEVSRRDVAGLYIYDNFLFAVKVTGQQVKDYLEYSMRYFRQVPGPGSYSMDQVTNAPSQGVPIPDYNFDTIAGLDARLSYDVDLAQPVGSRIIGLAYGGNPVTPAQEFALAVNNYRQSGGGGFPAVSTAPVLYSNSTDIRQLLIDWVGAHHTIDPTQFASVDWRLVANGQPLTIT